MRFEYRPSHPHDPDAYGQGEYHTRVRPTTQHAASATGAEPDKVDMAAMRAQGEGHHLRTLEEITEIYDATQTAANRWEAYCPIHESTGFHKTPSLHISRGNTQPVLLNCITQHCDVKEILAAKGLSFADISDVRDGYRLVDEYLYTDERGLPVYKVGREEKPAAKNRFPQSRWQDGEWKSGNSGSAILLFRLPRVKQAIAAGETIYVCEGEKDAKTLEALGLVGTTHSGGKLAGETSEYDKRKLHAYDALRGAASVVVLPDIDPDGGGQKSGKVIANHLSAFIPCVKLVMLPSPGGQKVDITNWIETGHAKADLDALVSRHKASKVGTPEAATEWTLTGINHADLPEPQWLVPGLISRPGTFVLAGRPKIAKKSWLVLDMAFALATGGMVLGNKVEQTKVLYLALEDYPRRMKDRARKMRLADSTNLTIVCSDGMAVIKRQGIVAYLHDYMARHPDTGAIFIDTLKCVWIVKDGNSYDETYNAMNDLKALAYDYDIALAFVHHTTKAVEGEDWANTIMGSTGLIAAADAYAVVRQAGKTFSARGKDIDDIDWAVQFDRIKWRYQVLGNAVQVAQSDARQEILDTLAMSGSDGMTPKEVAEEISRKPNNVRQLLLKLKRDGMVQENHGKYKPLIIPSARPTSEQVVDGDAGSADIEEEEPQSQSGTTTVGHNSESSANEPITEGLWGGARAELDRLRAEG